MIRIQAWPDYHVIFKDRTMAMSIIKAFSHTTHYKSVRQYAVDWHQMFDNAREYNTEESEVYNDANILQGIFEARLQELIAAHGVPGLEDPDDSGTISSLCDRLRASTNSPIQMILQKIR